MARNTAVQVLDDLTGEPAAETVGFGLDGIDYDIDLSFANAEALREFLQRYAGAGRRTGGRKNRPRIVPGAKKTPPAAKPKAAPAKATPAKAAPAKATPAKATQAKAKATTTVKPAPAKPTRAKAEPAKPVRAKQAAEPKATTRAVARKIPTVTFSAAE
ncbi:histone-like nucleoid-structuring protein Lsr2 [Amycolatopsis sp. MtRt-6]|uniref:Lsr2 dimerization domain-containing protein n=1 Tax=Amycolatopsis sp. MtRt-6 TaxID=2792782 RepID=UPI0027DE0381|nr:histone-like nucleoid-structuring protein Lsr2 [Amycolatopsis sp. MtRt-6]